MYRIIWDGKEKFYGTEQNKAINGFFNFLTFSTRENSQEADNKIMFYLNNLAKYLGLDLTITRE